MSSSNPFDSLEENDISAEDMSRFISYDPATGFLTWKPRDEGYYEDPVHLKRWNDFYAGTKIGTLTCHGYITFRVFGKIRKAHRVAWLLHHGSWPKGQIDHMNGERTDNRIENMRDVSGLENMRNRTLNKNSTSGFRGVYWNTVLKKWRAHIKNKGVNIHLGYFDNFEEAVEVRIKAESEIGFHSNHGKIRSVK